MGQSICDKMCHMDNNNTLKNLVESLQRSSQKDTSESHLWYAVKNALDPITLISTLSEALRISSEEVRVLLKKNGFEDIVAQAASKASESANDSTGADYVISKGAVSTVFDDLLSVEFFPSLSAPIKMSPSRIESIDALVASFTKSAHNDPFGNLFRKGVMEYHDSFIEGDARKIDEYIRSNFKDGRFKYLVNSGIGGDEMFNHFVADYYNTQPNRKFEWFVWDSPRHLLKLPKDANVDNTLFMGFSRSGKTEETVKIHEYTPRNAKKIVFANGGPLRAIGERDGSLILPMPDQVSGRFGRNTTPYLIAPMYAAGLDTKAFWQKIVESITKFDLSSRGSLPVQMAMFLYTFFVKNKYNHIYLGANDPLLTRSADEFVQFWDEGVNKNGNDLMMARYTELLRDSHLILEGILGNAKTKLAIFLVRGSFWSDELNPMISKKIDAINEAHSHLTFGQEEEMLIDANVQRCAEVMPTIKISIKGTPNLDHAVVLGQLWMDTTFVFSRLMNVDPGSNPEVKFVRDRASELLATK